MIAARSADGLTRSAADLRTRGAQVVAVPADVGIEADSQRVIAAAVEHYGHLDVLVANAGVIQVGPAAAMRRTDYANSLDVMFWGLLHPALAALPVMREQGRGRILVITSIGGKLPAPHMLPYTVAKHAAVGFAEGLGVEARRHGITVTTAVPGLMRTGSPSNALFTGDQRAEYGWFAVADSLPLLSMNAERAAAKLIRATLRGRREVILTPAAKAAVRLHGLAPSTTLRILAVANRLLPSDEESRPLAAGHEVGRPGPFVTALTGLTRSAARRFHQRDDPAESP